MEGRGQSTASTDGNPNKISLRYSPYAQTLGKAPVLQFRFVIEHQLVLLQATMKFLQAASSTERRKEGLPCLPSSTVTKRFASPRFSCQLLRGGALFDSASFIYRIDFELSKGHFPASEPMMTLFPC